MIAFRSYVAIVLLLGAVIPPLPAMASGAEARKEYIAGNYQAALPLAQAASERGDNSAKVVLGMMYYKGQGVSRDYGAALKLWREAAGRGNAKAQNNIGMMYQNGTGVEKNYTEAVKWYQLAAKQNYGLAYSNLGVLYRYGRGVGKDYRQSLDHLKKADQLLRRELALDPANAAATKDSIEFVRDQIAEVSPLVQN